MDDGYFGLVTAYRGAWERIGSLLNPAP